MGGEYYVSRAACEWGRRSQIQNVRTESTFTDRLEKQTQREDITAQDHLSGERQSQAESLLTSSQTDLNYQSTFPGYQLHRIL